MKPRFVLLINIIRARYLLKKLRWSLLKCMRAFIFIWFCAVEFCYLSGKKVYLYTQCISCIMTFHVILLLILFAGYCCTFAIKLNLWLAALLWELLLKQTSWWMLQMSCPRTLTESLMHMEHKNRKAFKKSPWLFWCYMMLNKMNCKFTVKAATYSRLSDCLATGDSMCNSK